MAARPSWVLLLVFGRFVAARGLVAMAAGRMHPPTGQPSAGAETLADVDPSELLGGLRTDGIFQGLALPPAAAIEIRRYAESNICYGGRDWNTPVHPWDPAEAERRAGCRILAANFPDADRECPAVAALIRNPWLHDIAGAYLGARPVMLDLRLWWSFPAEGASRRELSRVAQDTYHFDLADWRQLKFFFYLTDVDEETGAHVYVLGSHVNRPFSEQFTPFFARPDSEILAAHGRERIRIVTGPAGTGFVEDPFGYHTGSAVRRDRRLILEISFGITGTTRRRRFGQVAGQARDPEPDRLQHPT